MAQRPPIPDSFFCPITKDPLTDPVLCDDGYTYEREAIATWLQQARREIDDWTGFPAPPRSPLTNLPLRSLTLTPNIALRQAIEAWFDCYPDMRVKRARMDLQDVRVAVESMRTEAEGKNERSQRRACELRQVIFALEADRESLMRELENEKEISERLRGDLNRLRHSSQVRRLSDGYTTTSTRTPTATTATSTRDERREAAEPSRNSSDGRRRLLTSPSLLDDSLSNNASDEEAPEASYELSEAQLRGASSTILQSQQIELPKALTLEEAEEIDASSPYRYSLEVPDSRFFDDPEIYAVRFMEDADWRSYFRVDCLLCRKQCWDYNGGHCTSVRHLRHVSWLRRGWRFYEE
ncbi:unnamed protein product [Amoebophrya sp. A25]|nr:unnamed protein product [Amoebophrya sp. A25]|eukprot:GSA25T00002624001.1